MSVATMSISFTSKFDTPHNKGCALPTPPSTPPYNRSLETCSETTFKLLERPMNATIHLNGANEMSSYRKSSDNYHLWTPFDELEEQLKKLDLTNGQELDEKGGKRRPVGGGIDGPQKRLCGDLAEDGSADQSHATIRMKEFLKIESIMKDLMNPDHLTETMLTPTFPQPHSFVHTSSDSEIFKSSSSPLPASPPRGQACGPPGSPVGFPRTIENAMIPSTQTCGPPNNFMKQYIHQEPRGPPSDCISRSSHLSKERVGNDNSSSTTSNSLTMHRGIFGFNQDMNGVFTSVSMDRSNTQVSLSMAQNSLLCYSSPQYCPVQVPSPSSSLHSSSPQYSPPQVPSPSSPEQAHLQMSPSLPHSPSCSRSPSSYNADSLSGGCRDFLLDQTSLLPASVVQPIPYSPNRIFSYCASSPQATSPNLNSSGISSWHLQSSEVPVGVSYHLPSPVPPPVSPTHIRIPVVSPQSSRLSSAHLSPKSSPQSSPLSSALLSPKSSPQSSPLSSALLSPKSSSQSSPHSSSSPPCFISQMNFDISSLIDDDTLNLLIKEDGTWAVDDKDGETFLHYLSCLDDEAGAVMCLEHVSCRKGFHDNINRPNKHSETPLYCAVEMGRPLLTEYLVRKGADVNIKCCNSSHDTEQTPLHLAVERGYVNIVEVLLESNLDVNVKRSPDNFTPLMLALEKLRNGDRKNDRFSIIELLVDNEADFTVREVKSDKTPLMMAVESKDIRVVELFLQTAGVLKARELVNQQTRAGNSSLHIAAGLQYVAENIKKQLLSLLIRFGGDTNLRNKEGETPKDLASNLIASVARML